MTTRSVLSDAFDHHIWATLRLIDTCAELDEDQLAATVIGTYGSIIDTMRHIVAGDNGYLYALTNGRRATPDVSSMSLAELRAEIATNQPLWRSVIEEDTDPDAIVVRRRDDGSESHAPRGVRLAQALHHGTDHRSQICTILTTLDVEPPDIGVWEFADEGGRLHEISAT